MVRSSRTRGGVWSCFTPLLSSRTSPSEHDSASEFDPEEEEVVSLLSCEREGTSGFEAADDGRDLDIVQFTSPIYFAEECEHVACIDVMRLGSMHGRMAVKYHTEDASGRAGKRYVQTSGELIFESGETDKRVQVSIVESRSWSTTLEFKVCLADPVNCELGLYLHTCRVKVLDNDPFPSDRYRNQIKDGEESIRRINKIGLLWQFLKLNFMEEGMAWRTLLTLIFDQLKNIYLLIKINLNIYMVDVMFDVKHPSGEDRLLGRTLEETALIIGCLYALPMIALHIWDIVRSYLDLEGRTAVFLQTNLFTKFLNLTEEARLEVRSTGLELAIIDNVPRMAHGYAAFLHLLQYVGKVSILTYLMSMKNPKMLWVVALMLFCIIVFSIFWTGARQSTRKQKTELMHFVHETCAKFRLVADYFKRPLMNDRLKEKVEALRAAEVAKRVGSLNAQYFSYWLGPIIIGAYIAVSSPDIIDPDCSLTLGDFLATINMFAQLSTDFSDIYEQFYVLQRVSGPLKSLTHLFNLPTDLACWKSVNRARRHWTSEARDAVISTRVENPGEAATAFKSDRIYLNLVDMSFRYNPELAYVLRSVNLSVPQGKLTAVVGPPHSGKDTLMRLLGHTLFPTNGQVCIPTYLRILNVSMEPLLFDLSPWENLTFGCANAKDASPARIGAILTRLKMFQTTALVEEELATTTPKSCRSPRRECVNGGSEAGQSFYGEQDTGPPSERSENGHHEEADVDHTQLPVQDSVWMERITRTEHAKIHIARALIMNPEVLVLHRPLHHYDPDTAIEILRCVREYVDNKGFCMASSTAHRRRPRSCFFTTDRTEEVNEADIVWTINPHDKIVEQKDAKTHWFRS